MAFAPVLPLLCWLLALCFAPQWLQQFPLPIPASLYWAMGFVALLAGILRQWSWLYWLAWLAGIYLTIQSGLQRPLSEPGVLALYQALPVWITLSAIALNVFSLPPLLTWRGALLATVIAFSPCLLLFQVLATPFSLINPATWFPAGLAYRHALWVVIVAVAVIWIAVLRYHDSGARDWSRFSAWFACLAFLTVIELPPASAWAMLVSIVSLLMALLLQLLHLAYIDELTGLPQRRALLSQLAHLGKRSAVTMLDVDHFKRFNDTHGHDVGDQVLRLLGRILQSGRGFKAYRYGGEEFTLVFRHAQRDKIQQTLDEVRQQVADYPLRVREAKRDDKSRSSKQQARKRRGQAQAGGKTLRITISLGCAIRQPGEHTEQLLKRADEALYQAKKAGRNRVSMAK
ncbi:sensor domain-containing diguanylate cyclase [Idiomarina xiamenensis]|uniref:diguanylate cyclase n=1 Tax=Idiomarina xiamenensis 10-D-4 TaxID=740709 RepID=K2KPV3_9GAMM|nr:GGDEF domain-containing protein [Idiomarina xiamenensis]EKE84499.1 signal protein [Idiomarina xiamenensis 10-D-4]